MRTYLDAARKRENAESYECSWSLDYHQPQELHWYDDGEEFLCADCALRCDYAEESKGISLLAALAELRAGKHPIDRVYWVERDSLLSNDYNPNRQIDATQDLLVESIRASGWTQPIVVRPADGAGKHVIVDGEHRWRASARLIRDFGTQVPVVILDATTDGCIAATVRHNRARGAHCVDSMVEIIGRLRAEGLSDEEARVALGMSAEEYARLVASEETFLAIMGGSDGVMGA